MHDRRNPLTHRPAPSESGDARPHLRQVKPTSPPPPPSPPRRMTEAPQVPAPADSGRRMTDSPRHPASPMSTGRRMTEAPASPLASTGRRMTEPPETYHPQQSHLREPETWTPPVREARDIRRSMGAAHSPSFVEEALSIDQRPFHADLGTPYRPGTPDEPRHSSRAPHGLADFDSREREAETSQLQARPAHKTARQFPPAYADAPPVEVRRAEASEEVYAKTKSFPSSRNDDQDATSRPRRATAHRARDEVRKASAAPAAHEPAAFDRGPAPARRASTREERDRAPSPRAQRPTERAIESEPADQIDEAWTPPRSGMSPGYAAPPAQQVAAHQRAPQVPAPHAPPAFPSPAFAPILAPMPAAIGSTRPTEVAEAPSGNGRLAWFVFGAAFGICFAFFATGFVPRLGKKEEPPVVANEPAASAVQSVQSARVQNAPLMPLVQSASDSVLPNGVPVAAQPQGVQVPAVPSPAMQPVQASAPLPAAVIPPSAAAPPQPYVPPVQAPAPVPRVARPAAPRAAPAEDSAPARRSTPPVDLLNAGLGP